MIAWKSLQKDLDSRRYKSNPFEQKYVDLTTSSYTAENMTNEESLDLDYLSKSIRARSDIITCQIAYLLKEATDVSETFVRASTKKNQQKKTKLINDGYFDNGDYFVDQGQPLHYQQRDKVDVHEKDQRTSLRNMIMGDDLLWINDLISMLRPSKVDEILSEFYRNDDPPLRPTSNFHENLFPRKDIAPTSYPSTENFLFNKYGR